MKTTVQSEQRPKVQAHREPEYILPEVNIFETKEGYVVEADMPGVGKQGLEITLEGNEITLVGHRGNDLVNGTPLLRERNLADYRRVFELDPAIDTSKIAAKMEEGVLSLTLPKSEAVKPRRIAVD